MFREEYENVANILYTYACAMFVLFAIAAVILLFFGITQISSSSGIMLILIAVGTVVTGIAHTIVFFAISKLIKNGDRQFEQNKEIIKLLSK